MHLCTLVFFAKFALVVARLKFSLVEPREVAKENEQRQSRYCEG